jgi:hypothetical protein
MVRIVEARPLSKNKRWVLKEVVRAAAILPSSSQVSTATASQVS